MTMRFIDGFDYLTAANLNLKWDNSPGSWSLVTGVYNKGKGLNQSSATMTKTLPSNYVTGMVAFHIYINTLQSTRPIFSFNDASTVQTNLELDSLGDLIVTQNGTVLGTTTYRVVAGQWYWIEMQVTINNSTGAVNLYVGSTSVLTLTGVKTQGSSNAYFNQLQFVGTNGGIYIDSFHFWDSTAGDVTTFPYGEHIIDTELATAVGTNSQWNKGGTVINTYNYQQVNEANEDGDTTYVWMSASGAGDIDSYQFVPLQESTIPVGGIGTIAVNTIDRIDDAGPHSFQHYILSSGNSAIATAISPGATYVNHQDFFGTDPNTLTAWTIAGRNACEFGYRFIS